MPIQSTISFAEALLGEALVIILDPKFRQWAATQPGKGILLALAKVQTDCYGLDTDPHTFARYMMLLYTEQMSK